MALRIIFITGTDTGVGKTVLTSLLLSHLRQTDHRALALKPFCSGSTNGLTDVDILYELQDHELAPHEINPFFFPEPLAPLVAARRHRCKITLDDALSHIRSIITTHLTPIARAHQSADPTIHLSGPPSIHQSTNPSIHSSTTPSLHHSSPPFLLIEGAGGLLTPLGEGFNLLDIITSFASAEHNPLGSNPSINNPTSKIQHPKSQIQTVIVSRNQLGTINHTLLTAQALRDVVKRSPEFADYPSVITIALMQPASPDLSSRTNVAILTELLSPTLVITIPFFRKNLMKMAEIHQISKKYKKTLARILH